MDEGNWPFDQGSAALSGLLGLIRELRKSGTLTEEQAAALIEGVSNSTPPAGRAGVREMFETYTKP